MPMSWSLDEKGDWKAPLIPLPSLCIVNDPRTLSQGRLQWRLAHGNLRGKGCGRGLMDADPGGYQAMAGSLTASPPLLAVCSL